MANEPITIKIEGLEDILKGLDPKLASDAVRSTTNKLIFKARENVISEMKSVFDRPTPWTLSSVFVQKATNENLSAFIFIKDQATKGTPPAKYLRFEIFGGNRRQKGFEKLLAKTGVIESGEYLIPYKVPLNQYGNVSPGVIQKVLSGLQAQNDPYQDSPVLGQAYKGTRRGRKVPRRYFSVRRGGKTIIFEKQLDSSNDGHVTPMFVSSSRALYKPRLRFFEVIKRTVASAQIEFNHELEYYIGKWFKKR
ncbi:MAG: hypothetical protein JXN64_00315 [Spirochaetes bacterium]|nr:hypothetical protein [Spirochaetota bacterium]